MKYRRFHTRAGPGINAPCPLPPPPAICPIHIVFILGLSENFHDITNVFKLSKNQQRNIKAKATAVSNVISHMDIAGNPKAMARAGEVWSQVEKSRQEYQSMLDVAFDTMSGDEGLAEAMRDDEKQWDRLAGIEAKLEELRIMTEEAEGASREKKLMRDNEKQWDRLTGIEAKLEELRIRTEEAEGASREKKLIEGTSHDLGNQRKKERTDQQQFIQLQTTTNRESEGKLRRDATVRQMQTRTDNPRSTKSGKPETRLLTARPQKYSGAVSEYIQWKRTWQEERKDSEETEEAHSVS